MRIIARFEKGERIRFVSHLDIQRTFQRAFRRADIPLAYSQGFNPHPQLSFAAALSLGYTSEAEWFDVKLAEEMEPDAFSAAVNAALPAGFRILEALAAPDSLPALSALMAAASYTVRIFPEGLSSDMLVRVFNTMAEGPILVEKRTKGGMKTVDIRPLLLDYHFSQTAECLCMQLVGVADASGSLGLELLFGALRERSPGGFSCRVHREAIYSLQGTVLPALPPELSKR